MNKIDEDRFSEKQFINEILFGIPFVLFVTQFKFAKISDFIQKNIYVNYLKDLKNDNA